MIENIKQMLKVPIKKAATKIESYRIKNKLEKSESGLISVRFDEEDK